MGLNRLASHPNHPQLSALTYTWSLETFYELLTSIWSKKLHSVPLNHMLTRPAPITCSLRLISLLSNLWEKKSPSDTAACLFSKP